MRVVCLLRISRPLLATLCLAQLPFSRGKVLLERVERQDVNGWEREGDTERTSVRERGQWMSRSAPRVTKLTELVPLSSAEFAR